MSKLRHGLRGVLRGRSSVQVRIGKSFCAIFSVARIAFTFVKGPKYRPPPASRRRTKRMRGNGSFVMRKYG